MSIKTAVESIYRSLCQLALSHPLVLLHPIGRYNNILVAKLSQDESIHSFYYALQAPDKRLKSFLENIGTELSWQAEESDIEKKISQVLIATDGLPESLGETVKQFGQILNDLSNRPYLLILDDFDLADRASELQAFMDALAGVLPTHAHIIIRSRQVPRLSWLELIARNQAAIFLDGQSLDENFLNPAQKKQGEFDFEAFALYGGRVLYKGKVVDDWEGLLPKLLFFFVLNRGTVTRSEICQTFWPQLSSHQAVNVFHVTKRRLHKALGRDILMHNDEQYYIDTSLSVYYDVIAFLETIVKARNASKPNELWQKAIALHNQPFLEPYNEPWIQLSRDAFNAALAEAIEALS